MLGNKEVFLLSDSQFEHSYSRSAYETGLPDTARGRRKALLVPAVLLNLCIVVMECIATVQLWQQHPVFKDLAVFYTHQSNVLALFCSALFVLFGVIALFRDGRMPHGIKVFRLMCTAQLYITFIVVLCGLAPMGLIQGQSLGAMYGGPMFVMHLMAPLVSLLSFVFLEGTPRLTLGDSWLAVQYTWLYSLVMVILNAAGKVEGPYPFLMVQANPWWMNLLYAVILLPGGYLVCLCGKWLNNGIACRLSGEEKE